MGSGEVLLAFFLPILIMVLVFLIVGLAVIGYGLIDLAALVSADPNVLTERLIKEHPSLVSVAILIVFSSLYLSMLFFSLFFIKKKSHKLAYFGFKTFNIKYLFLSFILGLLILFIGLSFELIKDFSTIYMIKFGIKTNFEIFLSLLITTGIIGPFSEETYFRGLCYLYLRKKTGIVGGNLISSLFFAILHGVDPFVFFPVMIAGILLASLYEKYLSIPMVAVAHSTNNVLALLIF